MEAVKLNLSDEQKKRLMKGYRVRVGNADIGNGITILVSPRIARGLRTAKKNGKGKDIQLTPTEINKQGAGLSSWIKKGFKLAKDTGLLDKVTRAGVNAINRRAGYEVINADQAAALANTGASKLTGGGRRRRRATSKRLSRKSTKKSRKASKRGGSFRTGGSLKRSKKVSRRVSRKGSRRGGSFRIR